ncbi:hypothetical protein [Haloarcula japonica]|uniref:Uncharacterized protein n=1 Tax=Haloarcula japonica (strain ATCC 49778 / DSM 6131 / JCM 7785 / NBRC 101032 / NCIMB 13157 / TR-1) TaxID=1227453 RepID=M0L405_HALJT|nr:hypothetical protein [Haloarcula japonica]EMA27818.1 hypothetical protein C444_20077 [Haloarcula japonica DSM 6131]
MGTGEGENSTISLLGRTVPVQVLKPRIVLGLLLGGSLAGIWVANLAAPVLVRVFKWATLATLGVLVGGLYWRLALFDRSEFAEDDTYRAVTHRWQRIKTIAVVGFVLSGLVHLGLGVRDGQFGTGRVALGIGIISGLVLWVGIRGIADGSLTRRTVSVRSTLLLASLVSLAGFAWLETGTTLVDWGVRLAHVGAFSLWFGGAIWHNFVVLPTVRSRPDAGEALKPQAHAFRRHLPVAISVVFVTGIYQTAGLIGLSAPALLASPIGLLVGTKLLVLAVLTAMVAASFKRNG